MVILVGVADDKVGEKRSSVLRKKGVAVEEVGTSCLCCAVRRTIGLQ